MSGGRPQRIGFKTRACLCLLALVAFLLGGCKHPSGNMELVITGHGTDGLDTICRDFRLTAAQAREFFTKARPISPTQLHDEYEYMPCWVAGKTTGPQGSSVWKIRPIGVAEVTLPDHSRTLLGCKACDDLFK